MEPLAKSASGPSVLLFVPTEHGTERSKRLRGAHANESGAWYQRWERPRSLGSASKTIRYAVSACSSGTITRPPSISTCKPRDRRIAAIKSAMVRRLLTTIVQPSMPNFCEINITLWASQDLDTCDTFSSSDGSGIIDTYDIFARIVHYGSRQPTSAGY